jgi:hypothetical protein
MTYLGLACCLSLTAFGAVSLVAALLVWPAVRRHLTGTEPRGGTLLALRCAPTIAGVIVAGAIFLPSFLRLEPRQSGERVGVTMIGMGAAVALMLLAGSLRALRSVLATRALERCWRVGAAEVVLPEFPLPAFAIDEPFPLIAVVGVVRPRLYVARQVLECCTRDEIAAIVAHETAHVSRHDNLKRLLLRACPDVLAFAPVCERIERAWSEASERAADDHAAARTGSRLDLAAALVKVARSLRAPAPAGGVLAAFCREEEITTRVRRLLHPAPEPAGSGLTAHRLALVLGPVLVALVAVAQNAGVAARIHGVTESLVHFLQ